MNSDRKYKFSWSLLGDIEAGRPNLGNTTRLEVYRLLQFAFRDVIEQHVGTEETDKILSMLPKALIDELAEVILSENNLSEEEAKN